MHRWEPAYPSIPESDVLSLTRPTISRMADEKVAKKKEVVFGAVTSKERQESATRNCCGNEAASNRIGSFFRIRPHCLRILFAEFLGTALLVALGDGAVAQVVTSGGAKGDFFTINIAFAFGVAYGMYVSGSVSGGHINPAVTLVMAYLGKTPWYFIPVYWIAQYSGAFVGALVVHMVYQAAIKHFGHGLYYITGPNATAGIFATYPAGPWVTSLDGCVDQIVGTAILMLAILAVTDERNLRVPAHIKPIVVGFVVGVIGMSFGYNAYFALNPARDLGPRLYTAIAGWGWEVFSFRDYDWFWVPIAGPHAGAFLGMLIYKVLVGHHFPPGTEIEVRHEDERILVHNMLSGE